MAKSSGRPPRSESDVREFRSKVAKHALALYREEGFGSLSMRRLAKEAGCAPMTIYAHFDGKTDILKHLWADVLAEVTNIIREKLTSIAAPGDRLQMAAQTFVAYWIDHPDHFRLVFLSNDVVRSDVSTFIQDPQTLEHFQVFLDLVQDVVAPEAVAPDRNVKARTDTLIASMIGVALCINTVPDYPWTSAPQMTDHLLASILK